MITPDIKKGQSKTARRAYRQNAPFVIANRKDLDEARAKGCSRCGYRGMAITFLPWYKGCRRPTTCTTVSRATFLKSLAGCERVCLNCAAESRGHVGRKPKRRVCLQVSDTSKTQRALERSGLVSETAPPTSSE